MQQAQKNSSILVKYMRRLQNNAPSISSLIKPDISHAINSLKIAETLSFKSHHSSLGQFLILDVKPVLLRSQTFYKVIF